MKKIIFLTDLSNGEEEDFLTIEYLRKDYLVDIAYIDINFRKLFDYDLIVLRGTWPDSDSGMVEYSKNKRELLTFIENNKLKIYNELKSDFDRKGKKYLVDLFEQGYDVIPSFQNIDNIDDKYNEFILKPLDGFSSYGQKTLNREELLNIDFDNYILQPKIDFEHEVSFYFIDYNFLYSLIFAPSKIPKWPTPTVYNPEKSEIKKACSFVELNKMKKGVSRIDFLRLKTGELKLLEIEDDSPYFSITELPENLRSLFLSEFKNTIDRFIKKS